MAFSSDRSGVMPPDLAVDEVVMIVDSQLPRAMWLVGENLKIVSLGGWYSVVSGRASYPASDARWENLIDIFCYDVHLQCKYRGGCIYVPVGMDYITQNPLPSITGLISPCSSWSDSAPGLTMQERAVGNKGNNPSFVCYDWCLSHKCEIMWVMFRMLLF